MTSELAIANSAAINKDNGLPPETLAELPILLLNVHEQCNCRCLMCDIWQRTGGKELDLAEFSRQHESILRLGVQQVVLTGGEPLMHRNLEPLCRFFRQSGIRITLLTTGLLLSKRVSLVSEWIDDIIVSIDGPEEVHDRIRRVKGAYRLLADGVQAIKSRNEKIGIAGRCTVQNENHRMLRKTVLAAKALALDSISFLAVDLTSQAFNRDVVWPEGRQNGVALTREETVALDEEVRLLIREHTDDIRSHYIVESENKLSRIVRRFWEHLGDMQSVSPPCNAPWASAVMEVDGSVRPCFFHGSIGSTRTETLEQVINGEKARQFRVSLNIGENSVCQRCVCSLDYKWRKNSP